MAVNGISGVNLPIAPLSNDTAVTKEESSTGGISFSDYLKQALDYVSNLQLDADKASEDFALGNTDNIHDVLIAAEKADISLQFTMQVRNKIMDAYSEIMRMQI